MTFLSNRSETKQPRWTVTPYPCFRLSSACQAGANKKTGQASCSLSRFRDLLPSRHGRPNEDASGINASEGFQYAPWPAARKTRRLADPPGLSPHEVHQDELPEGHRVREIRFPAANRRHLLHEFHETPV